MTFEDHMNLLLMEGKFYTRRSEEHSDGILCIHPDYIKMYLRLSLSCSLAVHLKANRPTNTRVNLLRALS